MKLSWDEAIRKHMPEKPLEVPRESTAKRVRVKECPKCRRLYTVDRCPVCGK